MRNTDFSLLRVRQFPKQGGLRKFMGMSFLGLLILPMIFACSRPGPAPPVVTGTPQPRDAAEKSAPRAITPEPLKETPSSPVQVVTPGPTATPLPVTASPVATPEVAATPLPDEAAPLPDLSAMPGDPVRGERLVGTAGCNGCHTIKGVGGTVGPDLSGIAQRAPGRAASQKLEKPELYLVQSLVYPKAYVVEGFNPVMPNWKELQLTERDISDLVAYLMTLTGK